MKVHGDNLSGKEQHATKYLSAESKQYLREIREKYDAWSAANEALRGPFIAVEAGDEELLKERVRLFNEYKDFIDGQVYAEHFDSRSNLHSSVLEEFMYYLFRDLAQSYSTTALVGKAHSFKDLFFMPSSFSDMVSKPNMRIERKDHDFVIGARIKTTSKVDGSSSTEDHDFDVAAVAVECKTYLDKTMLEASSTAADQLKTRNPNAVYLVVMEYIKLTENVNLKKSKVDQIYVLRKQKNTDREFRYDDSFVKNPVYDDVVIHLFNFVRQHLTQPWEGGVAHGLSKGFLL